MIAKLYAVPVALLWALAACHAKPQATSAAPEPVITATATPAFAPPAPVVTAVPSAAPGVSVLPASTPCGADMLQNYLNLQPTTTAKDEIARTLGHNRVRYVGLQQEKAEASPRSSRVTAGIGVDGRIKEFACG